MPAFGIAEPGGPTRRSSRRRVAASKIVAILKDGSGPSAFPIDEGGAAERQGVIPPMRSTVKQRRNGTDFAVHMYIDAEMSAEPMPYDCERIVLLRLWATHHDGEVT